MKKILYLPIETIARELDARMLLAHEALSRGYTIVLGERHNVYKAAEILKSGVYFYKSHSAKNFPKNKFSDGSEFKFISLDEEGLVFVDDKEYLLNSKPHELEHLDIVFTWGSHQKDTLVKENPNLSGKTIPIGNPRFDLLRPEFGILYDSAKQRISKKWDNYILINTNFVPGNFSRLYDCSYIEFSRHLFLSIIGRNPSEEEDDFISREAVYYEKLFGQYVEMIKLLSERFPNMSFILRPHPSEDIINWREALKDLDNVFVIFEGNAIDWILGALTIIHTGCTTGIESWMLGKIVIAYNPNEDEGVEPLLPNKFGVRIKNEERLCSVVDEILKKNFKYNINEEQLDTAKSFIENVNGEYSVRKFMNSVDGLLDLNETGSEELSSVITDNDYRKLRTIENFKGAIKIRILKLLSKYQPLIKKAFRKKISDYIYGYFKKYPGLFAQFKKFPGLKSGKIVNRLNIYDKIFYKKQTGNYSIKKIATDTYILRKKPPEII